MRRNQLSVWMSGLRAVRDVDDDVDDVFFLPDLFWFALLEEEEDDDGAVLVFTREYPPKSTAPPSCGRNVKDDRASGFGEAGGKTGLCQAYVLQSYIHRSARYFVCCAVSWKPPNSRM